MAKWFFQASYTPKIDGKVNIAQKWLIVGSPDQFFWIWNVLAHQNYYCPNLFKNVYYFYYFYIVIRFFLAQIVKRFWTPSAGPWGPLRPFEDFWGYLRTEISCLKNSIDIGIKFLALPLLTNLDTPKKIKLWVQWCIIRIAFVKEMNRDWGWF